MNPSERIEQLIAGLKDLAREDARRHSQGHRRADREIIEEWKWMGSPVWSRDGMIAVGNAREGVRHLFAASLPDPDELFNAGLGGNKWRAIDLFRGDKIQ